jgi:hypothetical protein
MSPEDTFVVTVAELLPASVSGVDEPTTAVFVTIAPSPSALLTRTTNAKECIDAAATEVFAHDTVPVEPGSGVVHDQPSGAVSDSKVVSPGTSSDMSRTLLYRVHCS